MKILILFLATFTSSFLNFVNAQNPKWIVYNTSNSGLPGNGISSIAIDSSGYKWIGIYDYTGEPPDNGFAKFDGTNWTVYTTSNSGLPDNNVTSIAIDGNIKWIGTESGLAKFDGSNWTVYNTSNSGLPGNNVMSMALDSTINKWIGTSNGLAKFDGTNWIVYNSSNSGLPDNSIWSMALDGIGNKWIGTGYDGLAKFDGVNWTAYNSSNSGLPDNYIKSMSIDEIGNKWIGTIYDGMVKFDGTNWTVYNTANSGLPDNGIYSIAIDVSGTIWIGTFDSLTKFDGTNWTIYSNTNLSYSGTIHSIAIDGFGNKWIGTQSGGLVVFNENGIQFQISLISPSANYNICGSGNATFTITANETNLIYQWQESTDSGSTWNNLSNGGIYIGIDSTTLLLNNVPGSYNAYQYHCIVSDTLGDTLISNNAVLTVNPVAIAPVISMVGSNLVSSLASTYQWYFNGGIITGATSQTYTPLQNGIYTVVITDSAGCSATSVAYNLLNVGVVEIENERDFTILPNPASEILSIKYKVKSKKAEGSYMVYDIMGQMLLNGSFAKQEFQINISSLAKGVYLLKVEDENGVAVKRFVKE